MKGKKNTFQIITGALLIVCWSGLGVSLAHSSTQLTDEPLARLSAGWGGIYFQPKVRNEGMILSVSRPDGSVFQKTFESGSTPVFELTRECTDGTYTYELRLIQTMDRTRQDDSREGKESFLKKNKENQQPKPFIQTGYFTVKGGRIMGGDGPEPGDRQDPTDQDIIHNDDVIITFSLAVGNDAVNGENFGFDTIRLKENNLRIHFDDTSTASSFPRNDWRIIVNDSTDGGASYFSIEDSTAARRPFTVEAGAPTSSLYVDDIGRLGIKTSTPSVEAHIKDGDTPTVRLHQDGTSGWAPQTWDLAGNETNFFIRDVTNGSKLPFRIRPGAPTSSIDIRQNGDIGIGTASPQGDLDLYRSGSNPVFLIRRSPGTTIYFEAKENNVNFGSLTNSKVKFFIGGDAKMILREDGSMRMGNGAECTVAGVWQDASSRTFKENIKFLGADEAKKAFNNLNPVKYNYKSDQEEYLGFIAEDVPELVATKDRKGMSPMDVVAVLTKVVQEQQKALSELQERIAELEKKRKSEN